MKKEAKHTPGPILKEGETPLGVMLLAGPEDRETIIYLLGPERQQYARLFAAAPELLRALMFLVNAHEHPDAASSGRRGVNRRCFGEKEEISYTDASGVRVCWIVNRETSHD